MSRVTKVAANPLLIAELLKALRSGAQYAGRAAHGAASSAADVGAKLIGLSPNDNLKELYGRPFRTLRDSAAGPNWHINPATNSPDAGSGGILNAMRNNPEAVGGAITNAAPVVAGSAVLAHHALEKQNAYRAGIKSACAQRGVDPVALLKAAQQGPVPPVVPTTPVAPATPDPRAYIKARQSREQGRAGVGDDFEPSIRAGAITDWTPKSNYDPGWIHNSNPVTNTRNAIESAAQYANNTVGGWLGETPNEQRMNRIEMLAEQQRDARATASQQRQRINNADPGNAPLEYDEQYLKDYGKDPRTGAQMELANQITGRPDAPAVQALYKSRGYTPRPGGVGYYPPAMNAMRGGIMPTGIPNYHEGWNPNPLTYNTGTKLNPAMATTGILPTGRDAAAMAPKV